MNIPDPMSTASYADRSLRLQPASGFKADRPGELGDAEARELQELKKTDRQVRQHEQAHLTAGAGVIVSGAQFSYRRGPDGQLYAVSGEVKIDLSPVPGDPEATAEKARQVQRAALAPSDPSAQDRRVAMQARIMENQARAEAREQEQDESHDLPARIQLHSSLVDLLA